MGDISDINRRNEIYSSQNILKSESKKDATKYQSDVLDPDTQQLLAECVATIQAYFLKQGEVTKEDKELLINALKSLSSLQKKSSNQLINGDIESFLSFFPVAKDGTYSIPSYDVIKANLSKLETDIGSGVNMNQLLRELLNKVTDIYDSKIQKNGAYNDMINDLIDVMTGMMKTMGTVTEKSIQEVPSPPTSWDTIPDFIKEKIKDTPPFNDTNQYRWQLIDGKWSVQEAYSYERDGFWGPVTEHAWRDGTQGVLDKVIDKYSSIPGINDYEGWINDYYLECQKNPPLNLPTFADTNDIKNTISDLVNYRNECVKIVDSLTDMGSSSNDNLQKYVDEMRSNIDDLLKQCGLPESALTKDGKPIEVEVKISFERDPDTLADMMKVSYKNESSDWKTCPPQYRPIKTLQDWLAGLYKDHTLLDKIQSEMTSVSPQAANELNAILVWYNAIMEAIKMVTEASSQSSTQIARNAKGS